MASGASTRHLPDSQRRRARTEKSCGPDARRLASSLAVMRRPTGARIDHLRGDGGNSATLPEESAKDTVKTIAQGRPGDPARPVIHPVCVFWRTDLRVPAGARPSLRPCHDEGETRSKARASRAARSRILARCLKRVTARSVLDAAVPSPPELRRSRQAGHGSCIYSGSNRENRKSQWLAPPASVCVRSRRMPRAA
jgi:hypothetical protein